MIALDMVTIMSVLAAIFIIAVVFFIRQMIAIVRMPRYRLPTRQEAKAKLHPLDDLYTRVTFDD